jgi:hypothetical protein
MLLAEWVGSASFVRADVVGPFDPEAAEICGGSAHSPNCPPSLLGGACCGGVVLVVIAGVFAFRGRETGPREGGR